MSDLASDTNVSTVEYFFIYEVPEAIVTSKGADILLTGSLDTINCDLSGTFELEIPTNILKKDESNIYYNLRLNFENLNLKSVMNCFIDDFEPEVTIHPMLRYFSGNINTMCDSFVFFCDLSSIRESN